MKSSFGKTGDLLICVLLILAIPQLAGLLATTLLSRLPLLTQILQLLDAVREHLEI
jgi:hypothetical protein